MAEKNLHKGHRERMKTKFAKTMDLRNFEEHEILEMLLFYCYPQKNTNPIAHELINKFGSLSNVLNATYDQLVSSKIIGKNPAQTLKFLNAVNSYLHLKNAEKAIDVSDIPKLKAYVSAHFYGLEYEQLKLFFVDNSNTIKSYVDVQTGTSDSVSVSLRNITKAVLDRGSTSFFIAHNHPGRESTPSDEDIILTRRIISHLRSMDIYMLDHFIVGTDGVASMRQLGLIYDFEG